MKVSNYRLGLNLVILITVAGISVGCDSLRQQARDANSQPNTILTVTPRVSPEPGIAKTNPGIQVSKVEPQKPRLTHWLLDEGLFRISNGVWLNIGTLLLGGLGTILGFSNLSSGRINANEFSKELKALRNKFSDVNIALQGRTNSATFEHNNVQLSGRIESLEKHSNQTSTELAYIKSMLASYDFDRYSDKHQQLGATEPAVPSGIQLPKTDCFAAAQLASPPQPTLAELQAELTAAINRGDRQTVKGAIRSQLNITSESENAMSTGRQIQTELEEVGGGGSYWLAMLGGDAWLYPTDLTLKGFIQLQPLKGIFNYEKQQISVPQILTPALLEACGSKWRISQMGSIAVPG